MKSSSTGCLAAGKGHHSFLCFPVASLSLFPSVFFPLPLLAFSLPGIGAEPFLSSLITEAKREGKRDEGVQRSCGHSWGFSVPGQYPVRKRREGGEEDAGRRRERSSEALRNNINREEMKQHPHFFSFAYSLCLPPGIDNITPDILVTPFNCVTGDEARTLARAHTHWCRHWRDGTGCLFTLSFCALLKIAARSGKCHVLDLFAPLHTGGALEGLEPTWGGGFAETGVCSRDGPARLR